MTVSIIRLGEIIFQLCHHSVAIGFGRSVSSYYEYGYEDSILGLKEICMHKNSNKGVIG